MNTEPQKPRAKRNKTIVLTDDERTLYTKNLVFLDGLLSARSLEPQTTLAPCTTAPDTEKECARVPVIQPQTVAPIPRTAREPVTASFDAPCIPTAAPEPSAAPQTATPVPRTASASDTASSDAPCISAAALSSSAAPQTTAPDTEKECAHEPVTVSSDAPSMSAAAPEPSAEPQTAPAPCTVAPDTEKECAREPDTAFPAAPCISAAAFAPSAAPQTAPAPCTTAPDTEKECARVPVIQPQTVAPIPRTAREPVTASFDAPSMSAAAPEPSAEPQTAPAPCTVAPAAEKECARVPVIQPQTVAPIPRTARAPVTVSSDEPCIPTAAPESSAAPQTVAPDTEKECAREPVTAFPVAPCIPSAAPEPDTESLAVDTIPEPVPTRVPLSAVLDKTVCADLFAVLSLLPDSFADLLIVDPPYNMAKNFHGAKFSRINENSYTDYVRSWFVPLLRCLKPNASVYLCGDWKSSASLYRVLCEHTIVQNRITWQREKGRGAKANWKNTSEDIWFATCSQNYYFDVDAVKQKRRVLAPYRENGAPKDWEETKDGKFRLTYPGNFWDDISIPYWSMSENTDHPTQKSEKLIAKLILASCPVGGVVLDPFLGSGTTAVTAKKLGRRFVGIEQNAEYCLWAQKRLARAQEDGSIQGYTDGVFWERNSQKDQNRRHR